MGPLGVPKRRKRNYSYLLRNNPEEGSSRIVILYQKKLTNLVMKFFVYYIPT